MNPMVKLPRCSPILCALFVTASFLAGCDVKVPDTPVITTKVAKIDIPSHNRACPEITSEDIPDPDVSGVSQRDVAVFIPEVIGAAEHCRSDLLTVIAIVDDFNATAAEAEDVK